MRVLTQFVTVYVQPHSWQVPTPSIAQVSLAEIAVVDWVFKVRATSYFGFDWRQQESYEVVITDIYTYDKHG